MLSEGLKMKDYLKVLGWLFSPCYFKFISGDGLAAEQR